MDQHIDGEVVMRENEMERMKLIADALTVMKRDATGARLIDLWNRERSFGGKMFSQVVNSFSQEIKREEQGYGYVCGILTGKCPWYPVFVTWR